MPCSKCPFETSLSRTIMDPHSNVKADHYNERSWQIHLPHSYWLTILTSLLRQALMALLEFYLGTTLLSVFYFLTTGCFFLSGSFLLIKYYVTITLFLAFCSRAHPCSASHELYLIYNAKFTVNCCHGPSSWAISNRLMSKKKKNDEKENLDSHVNKWTRSV